ncbi:MAG TPA: (2Fe-2S)-binding protein [Firmicutes bacterium]|nr:(2Fe-2S)-binding protein [Bacillota bacterium]
MVVNGKPVSRRVRPDARLLDVLRDELGLMGTKEGCSRGECGACTVLVEGKAVNSCLMLALKAEGKRIITIEGLAANGELHPLQEAFLAHGAVQCGYCTPGMILSAKALLDENPHPSRAEIKRHMSGNLCRCTGYKKIIDAIEDVAGRGTSHD